MKNGDFIKKALIENTILLIGGCGFEKATTKGIVDLGIDDPAIHLNEVHIYRIFGSKDRLYAETFAVLDNELFSYVSHLVKTFFDEPGTFRERMRHLYDKIWRFLLENECRCRCYVRFYYSAYFREQTMRKHRELLNTHIKNFAPAFKKECDVVAVIHTAFMTLMDFAIRVFNGDLLDDEENTYHIFNLLYCSMSSYFDPDLAEDRRTRSITV